MKYKFDGFDFERLLGGEITIPATQVLSMFDISPTEGRVYLAFIALQFGTNKRIPTYDTVNQIVRGGTTIEEIAHLSGLSIAEAETALNKLVEKRFVNELASDDVLQPKSYYV